MNSSLSRLYEQVKFLLGFAIVAIAAVPLGDAVRGSMSPWIWHELANGKHITSAADTAVVVILYAAFYSLGFLVPFWATTFALFVGRLDSKLGGAGTPPMPAAHRRARLYIAIAGLTLFLLFLDSLLAFVRAAPSEVWNGLLLIFGIALAAALAFGAYAEFAGHARGASGKRTPE